MEHWLDVQFQSSSSKTAEFKSFARQFKSAIKKALPENSELVNFNTGHFYCSGFIKRGEKFAYFSISDVRFFKNDWFNKILIRTAKNEKDYTGGANHYTTLDTFKNYADSVLTGVSKQELASLGIG